MSLDVIEQEPQIALVGTKVDVEDRADDWDGTQQCVDRNVKDHARCNPAICAKAARTMDQMETDRCGDNVADDRQQAEDRVPAEADPGEGDEVPAVEERCLSVEVLQEPQIFRVYWVVRAGDRVAHADLLLAACLETTGSIVAASINGYASVRTIGRSPAASLAILPRGLRVLESGSYVQADPPIAVPTLLFPTDLASFLDLIRQHGDAAYSFMFAYATSHSLLFGLFAGYAAHSGALSFTTLIAVCWFGSFAGDVVRFWIGRRFGTRWLKSFPRLERAIKIAAHLADRHHVWMILLHRYPHGIRGVAGFAYGISPLPWSTFLLVNFVAAGLWSCAVVSAGYAFGQVSEKVMSDASSGLGLVMLLAFLALGWVLSKKLERIFERT